jgi:hypothetical protein
MFAGRIMPVGCTRAATSAIVRPAVFLRYARHFTTPFETQR